MIPASLSYSTSLQALQVLPDGVDWARVSREEHLISRPANTGTSFQPTGAVFKVHSPKAKVEGSRMEADGFRLDRASDSKFSVVNRDGVEVYRQVVASEMRPATTQVKQIHNISMATPDQHHILIKTDSQSSLGAEAAQGSYMGKLTQRVVKSGRPPSQNRQPMIAVETLQNAQAGQSTAALQTVQHPGQSAAALQTVQHANHSVASLQTLHHASQSAATLQVVHGSQSLSSFHGLQVAGQPASLQPGMIMANTLVTNTCKTVTTPVPIASKPVVRHATPQPATQPAPATTPSSTPPAPPASPLLKNVGVISAGGKVVQYQTVPSQQKTTQSGLLAALQSVTPALPTVQPQAQQQAVVHNVVLRTTPPAGSSGPALTPLLSPATVGRQPTHIQYILPSLTVQPGPKTLQMALPGQVVPANIQLAWPAQTATQSAGKIQLTPVTPAKATQPQPKLVAQPAPVALAQNVAAPTLEAINKVVQGQPQQSIQIVGSQMLGQQMVGSQVMGSQVVTLNQPTFSLTNGQQVQLTASGLAAVSIAATQPTQQQQQQQQHQPKILLSSAPK